MDNEIRESLKNKIWTPDKVKLGRLSPWRDRDKWVDGKLLLEMADRIVILRTPNYEFIKMNRHILDRNVDPNTTYLRPENVKDWHELMLDLLYKEFISTTMGDICE